MSYIRILIFMIFSFAATFMVGGVSALAHAYLDHPLPEAESQLHESPNQLMLGFSEDVEEQFCTIALFHENRTEVTISKPLHGGSNDQLIVELPPLSDDVYDVNWQVLSVDGHVTEGSYRFSVNRTLPEIRPDDAVEIGSNWGSAEDSQLTSVVDQTTPTKNVGVIKVTPNKIINNQIVRKTLAPLETSVPTTANLATLVPSDTSTIAKVSEDRSVQPVIIKKPLTIQNESIEDQHQIDMIQWRIIFWLLVILMVSPFVNWAGIQFVSETHRFIHRMVSIIMAGWLVQMEVQHLSHMAAIVQRSFYEMITESQIGYGMVARIAIVLFFLIVMQFNVVKVVWFNHLAGLALVFAIMWNSHSHPSGTFYTIVQWLFQTFHAWLAIGWIGGVGMLLLIRPEQTKWEEFSKRALRGMLMLIVLGVSLALFRVPIEIWMSPHWSTYVGLLAMKSVCVIIVLAFGWLLRRNMLSKHVYVLCSIELLIGFVIFCLSGWLSTTPLPS